MSNNVSLSDRCFPLTGSVDESSEGLSKQFLSAMSLVPLPGTFIFVCLYSIIRIMISDPLGSL